MQKRNYVVRNDKAEIQIETVDETETECKVFCNKIIETFIAERKSQGITQRKIADITGMKAPNVNRIESGNVIPTLSILFRYAKAMGKELHFELVDIEKEMSRCTEEVSKGDNAVTIDK